MPWAVQYAMKGAEFISGMNDERPQAMNCATRDKARKGESSLRAAIPFLNTVERSIRTQCVMELLLLALIHLCAFNYVSAMSVDQVEENRVGSRGPVAALGIAKGSNIDDHAPESDRELAEKKNLTQSFPS
jgi:hypothetical protein